MTVLFHHEGQIDLERAEAVRYTAPSGARVFSAGSYEFAWALDGYRVNGDGIETPVDPRVQQFVRNMLADLVRPAPPARVTARRSKHASVVTVAFSDPRIAGVVVMRQRGAGTFVTVCHARAKVCVDRAKLRPGVYRYEAILSDEWGRSDARASAPVRVQKPS